MSFRVRFTEEAQEDLGRLYDGLLERSGGGFRRAYPYMALGSCSR